MLSFSPPLVKGVLLKRYKRFLADVRLEGGQEVCAHCPNTGGMVGLTEPGTVVWLSKSQSATRQLPYTWELVEPVPGQFIGVNTHRPNQVIRHALQTGLLEDFKGYAHIQPEATVQQGTRLDFGLYHTIPEKKELADCYLEVKNVHFKQGVLALFPDSPTTRGIKHMQVLANLRQQGIRACVLYLVQRTDCDGFSLASSIDPAYAQAAIEAFERGVEPMAYACTLSPTGISIGQALPVLL